jgi:hypothetical protein
MTRFEIAHFDVAPRLPTQLFYAYYPAHLYVLHAIDVLSWRVF